MTAPARQPSAAILKLSGDVHGWRSVVLRETNFVDGAYLVKVDGVSNENNKKEQVQILFTERDAADLSYTLEIHLLKRESGKQALKLTRDIHAINSHTSPPAPRPPCEECMYQECIDNAAKAEREKVLHKLEVEMRKVKYTSFTSTMHIIESLMAGDEHGD